MALITARGDILLDHVSTHGSFWRRPVSAGTASAAVRRASERLLLDPPLSGPIHVPKALSTGLRVGMPRFAHLLVESPLAKSKPHAYLSSPASTLTTYILSRLFTHGRRRPLTPDHAAYVHIYVEYGLTSSKSGGCAVLSYAQSACYTAARRLHPTATSAYLHKHVMPTLPSQDPHLYRRMVRGSGDGFSPLWPTLAASASCMPVLLHPTLRMYSPTELTAAMLGIPITDPLVSELAALPPAFAHAALANGGHMFSLTAIFASLQRCSALSTIKVPPTCRTRIVPQRTGELESNGY